MKRQRTKGFLGLVLGMLCTFVTLSAFQPPTDQLDSSNQFGYSIKAKGEAYLTGTVIGKVVVKSEGVTMNWVTLKAAKNDECVLVRFDELSTFKLVRLGDNLILPKCYKLSLKNPLPAVATIPIRYVPRC